MFSLAEHAHFHLNIGTGATGSLDGLQKHVSRAKILLLIADGLPRRRSSAYRQGQDRDVAPRPLKDNTTPVALRWFNVTLLAVFR